MWLEAALSRQPRQSIFWMPWGRKSHVRLVSDVRRWVRTCLSRMTGIVRDSRGFRTLVRPAEELRYGLCSLRRTPAFTAAAVLILGLGIGMSTAMFTVFRAVLIQELPVRDPDRLVSLWTYRDPTVTLALVPQQLVGLQRESRTLQDAAGVVHYGAVAAPVTEGDRSLALDQAMVTANFFTVLGARPLLGRLLQPEDGDDALLLGGRGGGPAGREVAVISYQTWQRDFGGDPGVLGRRLTTSYNQVSYSIIGVAPPGLDYPVGADYWILLRPIDLVNVVARLAPGVTPEAARSEFLSIARVLDRERTIPVEPTAATLEPFTDAVLGNSRPILITLSAAAVMLLIIACVNVGSLLLMRATLRAREIVIRRALGAGYGSVARLLLGESALLGVAGGTLGLVCAVALLRVLLALAPAQLPRLDMIRLGGMPIAVAIGVTLAAVLFFGVFPVMAAARGNLASALRLDTRTGTGTRQRHRLRRSLVASQVALALLMLVAAGLLARSLQRLQQVELGYDEEGLSIVELVMPSMLSESFEQRLALYEELFRRVGAVSGVIALTPVLYRPFVGANVGQIPIMREGQSQAEAEANPPIPYEVVGPDYFRVFGVPILRGRGILDSDRVDAPRVAVLSEALAQRLWPDEDPIGKEFGVGSMANRIRVVGVAGDIRFRRLREPTPTIFVSWRQTLPQATFAIRTRGELATVLPAIRQVVRDLRPQMDLWRAGTMDDYLDEPLAPARLSALLLSSLRSWHCCSPRSDCMG
ncbi:MAG: FtsX-like permease family protein [Gemmatimonas sp.]|nr:FtsX-like permease family protein [Gemmatimonas sp.]